MKNERGFVSLFTCIMLSMLLLVITISLVSLEAVQLRKSEDSEQTLRAYYAAEAGIEDAAAKVLGGLRVDQPCVSQPGYDATGLAGWTCQRITFSGSPTGNVAADQAKTIDPGSVGYQSVVVEWNQSQNVNINVPGPGLPDQANYSANRYPPILEMGIVQYPRGPVASNDPRLILTNAVIVPRGGAAAQVPYAATATGQQFDGNCRHDTAPRSILGVTSVYNCAAVITNLNGGLDYLFRIRSRYGGTLYKMTFFSGPGATGAVLPVPDGNATVDVTSKAGDTYRRVISKIPINGGAAGGLNYVLYSDTNICKGFDVINNVPNSDGCNY